MRRARLIAAVVASLSLAVGTVAAQEQTASVSGKHLTITVTGQASATPDTMCLEFSSSATAGNASDALEQCKEKTDAAAKAIEALRVRNLTVTREMYQFSLPGTGTPYQIVQPSPAPTGTEVSQLLKVKVSQIGSTPRAELATTIAKVIDAAGKAGVGLSQAATLQARLTGVTDVEAVRYELEDATTLKRKALADAIARAEDVRKTFAGAGIVTEKLVSVSYNDVISSDTALALQCFVSQEQITDDRSASSSSPDEVVVRCGLTCVYELKDK